MSKFVIRQKVRKPRDANTVADAQAMLRERTALAHCPRGVHIQLGRTELKIKPVFRLAHDATKKYSVAGAMAALAEETDSSNLIKAAEREISEDEREFYARLLSSQL